MKSLWNKQVQQTETKSSKKDQKWEGGSKVQQKQFHRETENCEKKGFRRGAQERMTDRQVWEEHKRQSLESVSSANGWLHAGIQNSHFFTRVSCIK